MKKLWIVPLLAGSMLVGCAHDSDHNWMGFRKHHKGDENIQPTGVERSNRSYDSSGSVQGSADANAPSSTTPAPAPAPSSPNSNQSQPENSSPGDLNNSTTDPNNNGVNVSPEDGAPAKDQEPNTPQK
jgi:hypothetical protein